MESLLTRGRLETLIEGLAGKVVLVLGDLMLDQFVWGRVRRISPEAPVPVVDVVNETFVLGGAGNVAANIKSLGGVPIPIGVVGRDPAAEHVFDLIRERDIDGSAVVRENRPTTVKTRIIAQSQQIVRADRESREALPPECNRFLAASFEKWLPSAGAVVISDYDKGVIHSDLLPAVLPAARRAGVPVFLDPKGRHSESCRSITLIKPNQHEAELLTGRPIETHEQLEEAGRRLLQKFECEYALITRGEDGMSLFGRNQSHHLPSVDREVFDKTGAGDTVIATLALAHAGGATIEEAAVLANHAAGLVVGKVGTATVTRAELLDDF
jgi:D-beta-D-heptose 7-phosphate kinase/D-beta-D-heptose 1-phosphate adenosyltransferase